MPSNCLLVLFNASCKLHYFIIVLHFVSLGLCVCACFALYTWQLFWYDLEMLFLCFYWTYTFVEHANDLDYQSVAKILSVCNLDYSRIVLISSFLVKIAFSCSLKCFKDKFIGNVKILTFLHPFSNRCVLVFSFNNVVL